MAKERSSPIAVVVTADVEFFHENTCRLARMNINLQYQHKYSNCDNDFIILVVALLEIEKVVSRLTVWNHKIQYRNRRSVVLATGLFKY